ncbi:421_t:CDS:2 [Funneliformis caledonium]|uniref:type I protein arginine methyltransferase n=1 Tax=Funneliformis caledonium TaxID=1117310 RepID=A0A9N8YPT5_9GLOM|nr:421_t:CDS:2 [Funneliformis caledonium]
MLSESNGPLNASNKAPSTEGRDPAYFSYYAMLQHQQNMLQDTVRTSTYRSAILLNGPVCFQDKLVLDVGAGSGILSYFAVQAGARKVFAVEASNMAEKMQKVVDAANSSDAEALGKNAFLKDKIEVVQAKIEQPNLPIPQVDTIISEPIGVLLIHERMLESYLYARDHYLKPGGTLFPSTGSIFLAPFTDAALWSETMSKARFWEQPSFYGVDLTSLYTDAKDEMFGMPVVGGFDPRTLIAPANPGGFIIDFYTIKLEELQDFTVPFIWQASYTGIVHGIAGWFDLQFSPPATIPNGNPVTMTTNPSAERTHWQQVRFLLKEPLAVNAGQTIQGWMRCVVNEMRSYTIEAEILLINDGTGQLSDPLSSPSPILHLDFNRRRNKWRLHEQTYNYNYYPQTGNDNIFRPEYNCLYEPEQPLDVTVVVENNNLLDDTTNNQFVL